MISEAIEILKTYTDGKDNTDKVEISVMQLNRIIKALEQQPTDAVDRVTIKEYLDSFGKDTNDTTKDNNNEQMEFPDTWEEFEEYYGFYDTEEVYTNNSRLIPSFRVKQWLEHQMTAEEYRQRMMQAFHNAGCGELIAVCVLPTEKEFEHLEWLLKNHYKKPCGDCVSRAEVFAIAWDSCLDLESDADTKEFCDKIKALPPVTPKAETVTEFADRCRECGAKYGKLLKQDPCEDYISRQAVLDVLDKSKYSNEFCEEHHIDWSINLGMAHIVVNELKPVTPQPKMGRWIDVDGIWFKCSECDAHRKMMPAYKEYYCPNCGRKMQEEEE